MARLRETSAKLADRPAKLDSQRRERHPKIPGTGPERREQGMSNPARPAPDPRHEDLQAAARYPDETPAARPEHQRDGARRAVRAGELRLPAGRRIGIRRQRARPYDGHGRYTASDPSSRPRPNDARRDLLRSNGTDVSWPARNRQAADITKDRGRTPSQDAQVIRPSTTFISYMSTTQTLRSRWDMDEDFR